MPTEPAPRRMYDDEVCLRCGHPTVSGSHFSGAYFSRAGVCGKVTRVVPTEDRARWMVELGTAIDQMADEW